MNQLNAQIPHCIYNIIIFTETGLTSNIESFILCLIDYLNYCCVGNSHTSSLSKDSGITAMTDKINSKLISIFNNTIEILFVLILNYIIKQY